MASTEIAACQACKKTFTLSHCQQGIVTELKGKGLSFIMIECPNCGTSTPYMPDTIHEPTQHKQNDVYRCPVSHCSGWVAWIESSSFFGCGQCGSIWHDEKNLNDAIGQSVSNYPYRASCYKKINEQWTPAPIELQPDNYEELVELESFDHAQTVLRG